MMLRAALIVAVLALAAPTAADAARMPLPRATIVNTECPYYAEQGAHSSCADTETNVVYLSPGDGRWTKLHELGHLFDAQYLTDTTRAWMTTALGIPAGTPWWGETGIGLSGAQHTSPGEQFADIYAMCALGDIQRRYRPICNGIVVIALVADHR
jgi:hypothetical protein